MLENGCRHNLFLELDRGTEEQQFETRYHYRDPQYRLLLGGSWRNEEENLEIVSDSILTPWTT